MHILTMAGVLLVLIILVHIAFRLVKFTFSVFFLGIALIATVYIFQVYFGIDLPAIIMRHI